MEDRRNSITYFEDLSNEIIYEIFDYFDFCQVYDIFSNLNIRFENLLHHSKLPIKINLSSITKSTFEHYYTQIIIPNQSRIKSFIIDSIFSESIIKLNLIRLEKLTLHNIQLQYPHKLLTYLAFLPHLSSLTITFKHKIKNKTLFYDQLFHLPVLKYCQISLNGSDRYELLPYATNQFSPIETLLIKDSCSFDEFYALLSYLPQLRQLSVPFLFGVADKNGILLKHLTHLSINDGCFSFDVLEMMIENYFPQLQILYFSTRAKSDYFDVKRWQDLITNHMPYLRIFDIQISYFMISSENITGYVTQIEQFTSSFWLEHNWFFEYHINPVGVGYHINLFSTNPYRRKKYTLYKEENNNITQTISMNSVQHLEIQKKLETTNFMKYFPNVTQLTICCNFTLDDNYFNIIYLKDLIPLNQLTKLTIEYYHSSFTKILQLISYTHNLHTLIMNSVSFEKLNLSLFEHHEIYQLVSQTNNIKQIHITWPSTLEEIKHLVQLFPRLQYLTIHEYTDDLNFILNMLLSKYKVINSHNFSSNIQVTLRKISNTVKAMMKSDNLLENYSTEIIADDTLMIYTW